MNAPAPIAAVDAARAILADRHKAFTVSTANLFAICQALVDATDNPEPVITDELALAARSLIAVHDGFAARSQALGPEIALSISDAAYQAFKTQFETEFPE